MKLTLASLAAVVACSGAPVIQQSAPDIKPTDVDLNAAQTRTELLAQLSAKHEGYQDNGDFVYCTSDDDREKSFSKKQGQVNLSSLLHYTRYSARFEAGFDACERTLNPNPNLPFNSLCHGDTLILETSYVILEDLINYNPHATFRAWPYWCGLDNLDTSCTVPIFVKAVTTSTSPTDDICVRVETGKASIEQLPPSSNTPTFLR